ncbi:MAG TPA: peptidylprolyl isomerase [Candidatus Thermoplasmatota archaeon]|nr:peptidylprolyl isomerase [Candidatus Thermoplasmatota archaeon]
MPRALVLALALLLAGCVTPPSIGPDAAAPEVTFDSITIETAMGSFTAIVFCDETPETCAFMRELVESGYYDGRAFGRIIPGFVIQEVDRTGGTTDQLGTVVGEFGRNVTFSAGAFGIARNADPDSGGSEFFVMDHPASQLWGNYTAFAQIVDAQGIGVVHAIARVPAVKTGPASSVVGAPPGSPVAFGLHDRVPVDPVVMTKVTWGNLSLPAASAANYPLLTSDTVRTDTRRATLEWPRDLAANASSELTWYLWGRDIGPTGQARDPPPLTYDDLTVDVDGAPIAALEIDRTNGAIRFAWTPASAGLHHVRLSESGAEVAVGNVTVPAS